MTSSVVQLVMHVICMISQKLLFAAHVATCGQTEHREIQMFNRIRFRNMHNNLLSSANTLQGCTNHVETMKNSLSCCWGTVSLAAHHHACWGGRVLPLLLLSSLTASSAH